MNSTEDLVLRSMRDYLNLPSCPVKSFYKNLRFNDEPLLYQYTAISNIPNHSLSREKEAWGGGMSFNKKVAQIKALGESLERHCLGIYKKSYLFKSSERNLKGKALSPNKVVSVSETQKRNSKFNSFNFDERSIFNWIKGYSFPDKKKVWIPAQLVYVPYLYSREPVIRFPISTGAALGSSLKGAIYRGICEVVERDSFMIYYLNGLTPIEINLNKSAGFLKDIYKHFERYKLDLRLFDLTTDIGVPVSMAIIVDETTLGPHTSIGLKASVFFQEAVIGSIEEAQHTRPWMRDEMAKIKDKEFVIVKNSPNRISNPRVRGLFWFNGQNANKLEFWLRDRPKKKIIKKASKQKFNVTAREINKIIQKLKLRNYNIYYVDITTEDLSKAGFKVVKVIVPELQPLYLDEQYPYLGGERLYKVPKILGYKKNVLKEENLNKTPHPFL